MYISCEIHIFLSPPPFRITFFLQIHNLENGYILQVSEACANFEEFFLYFSCIMDRFGALKGELQGLPN